MNSVHIVGNGLFGTFLGGLFQQYGIEQDTNSDHVILAVPFDAYEEVSAQYKGKHLINVCSVQELSNNICIQNSDRVTGIHPMFGPRSPKEGRSVLLTHVCKDSEIILDVFRACECEIIKELPDGRAIDGMLHDQMMALTHGATVILADQLKPVVENANWIPENCLPASFKQVRNVVNQLGDMSEGTASSIKANRYLE